MAQLFLYLADYEILIYMCLGLGALFALRWFLIEWKHWREAIFGLEREFAVRRLTNAVGLVFLLILIAGSEYFLATFIAPSLPALIPTPTVDLLIQPTATLSIENGTVISVPPVLPPPGSVGCVVGALIITAPKPGEEVRGEITLKGTVDILNFGFYKYEVAPAGSEIWSTISAGDKVVKDGDLGFWNTTALTPGDYQLRLVVTDNQGNALPPCVIQVRVKAP
jgi:hypothetical protein